MISKRLSELRKRKQWSLQYIADQLNIAKSTYAGYESGYRQPSLEAVKELATLFGTTTDYLLGATDLGATDEEQPSIELTRPTVRLTVDGEAVTEDEIIQLIAFIRAKRDIENKK
ncbi:helix-turn-helix domain-containing protein [Anoxybacillus sp. ST4]|uniref:helix-turn-helix domain-containing protein n=1 Tax=Anoxybacillus sp. ST4 TaxID=2864181 RepID=UPI001C6420D7|nr:helix-turn-helix transcriptional regulator [Anoxybacillus sp. ST4]MBW7651978.1 helix-turn-helix transcriptional regulator [Anoxybacillus sp. ST4]